MIEVVKSKLLKWKKKTFRGVVAEGIKKSSDNTKQLDLGGVVIRTDVESESDTRQRNYENYVRLAGEQK